MAGLLETEPCLAGHCREDALDPALVDTADRHIPVLENPGFESIPGPEDDPLLRCLNHFERRTPSLLMLELEDQRQEFHRPQIHAKFLQEVV